DFCGPAASLGAVFVRSPVPNIGVSPPSANSTSRSLSTFFFRPGTSAIEKSPRSADTRPGGYGSFVKNSLPVNPIGPGDWHPSATCALAALVLPTDSSQARNCLQDQETDQVNVRPDDAPYRLENSQIPASDRKLSLRVHDNI